MKKVVIIFLAGIMSLNIAAESKNIQKSLSAEQQEVAVVSSYIISGDFIHTKKIVNKKFDLNFSLNEIENILKDSLSEYDFSPLHSYAVKNEQEENLEADRFLREYFFENSFVSNRDIDREIAIAAVLEKNSAVNTQLAVNNNFLEK